MGKTIVAATILSALAMTGAAAARTGQCYTMDGRPTGPAYESTAPDREWIRFVTSRGGRCTGVGGEAVSEHPRFTEHETPNHRHLERFQQMQRY